MSRVDNQLEVMLKKVFNKAITKNEIAGIPEQPHSYNQGRHIMTLKLTMFM